MSMNQDAQVIERAKLLTPAQVATELNVSLQVVYNLIRNRDLRAVDMAPSGKARRNGFWRISRECLDEFLSRRLTPARQPAPQAPKAVIRIPGYPDGVPNRLRL